jgi:phosphate transport system ATP-binding protein
MEKTVRPILKTNNPSSATEKGSAEMTKISVTAGAQRVRTFIDPVFTLEDVAVSYGNFTAVADVNLQIPSRDITAFIGPSGCGKSTLLRVFNRTNDLIPGAKVHGKVLYHDADLYARDASAVEVRRRIGMVFQNQIHFQSPSMKMWHSGPASMAAQRNLS